MASDGCMDANLKIIDTSIASRLTGEDWNSYQAAFTALPGSVFGQVCARAAAGSTVWVDDVVLSAR